MENVKEKPNWRRTKKYKKLSKRLYSAQCLPIGNICNITLNITEAYEKFGYLYDLFFVSYSYSWFLFLLICFTFLLFFKTNNYDLCAWSRIAFISFSCSHPQIMFTGALLLIVITSKSYQHILWKFSTFFHLHQTITKSCRQIKTFSSLSN